MSVDLIRFIIFAAVLIGLVAIALTSKTFGPYIRKAPLVAFLLGISSGFPLTLLVATMTFDTDRMAQLGISTSEIANAVKNQNEMERETLKDAQKMN